MQSGLAESPLGDEARVLSGADPFFDSVVVSKLGQAECLQYMALLGGGFGDGVVGELAHLHAVEAAR